MTEVAPVWVLEDLHKVYRSSMLGRQAHPALHGASLTVAGGERVGLIGPSGSGKTTLIRCGLGLVRPDSGRVQVLGRDANTLDRRGWQRLRSEVQVVFQDPRSMLHPDLPIGVLLEESAALHRPGEDRAAVAREALAAVGLEHRADALPGELSGGERRRAGIARVALTRPKLLVADEPTSGLDAVLKGKMVEMLLSAVGASCAVVLVSHDLQAIAPSCDRIAVLDQGRVVETFPTRALVAGFEPTEPTTQDLLAAAGWGEPVIAWFATAATLAHGGDEVPAVQACEDYRSYVDQARFFLGKGWYLDAQDQLEKAVTCEDGKLDPEAWYLLAKVRYELGNLQGARFAADRALVHSTDDQQAEQTHQLLSYLDQKFGFVTVDAPNDGVTAVVHVDLESTIFDPDLKVWLGHLQERLIQPVLLPHELGLPAGKYSINGMDVEVTPGSRQVISPRLGGGEDVLQSLQLELGLGATGFVGTGFGQLTPAPTVELSVGFPLGRLAFGVTGSWLPQPFTTVAGSFETELGGWSAGMRLGVELPKVQPLVIRPSLTARVASTPGLELSCSKVGNTAFTCSRDSSVQQMYVYTSAMEGALGVELLAEYLNRSRPSGFGAGLKFGGEGLVGRYPERALASSGNGDVTYQVVGNRTFFAGAWRVEAVATYGF